jgi:hypothetical protein
MKNTLKATYSVLGGVLVLMAQSSLANTVTVEKVSGTKAIVKFNGVNPTAGESYGLADGGGGGGGGAGTREHYIALSSNLLSKTMGVGGVMDFAVAGTFGWNMGQFEVGIPVQLGLLGERTAGAGSTTTAKAGVDFDFNFSDNNPGEMMVPFVHAVAKFGILKTATMIKNYDLGAGIGIKYFLNDQVAITAGLDFVLSKNMVAGAAASKVITIPLGIRAYF